MSGAPEQAGTGVPTGCRELVRSDRAVLRDDPIVREAMSDHLPPLRRSGEAGMPVTEVVTMRLVRSGKRPEHSHRVGVGEGEGRHGLITTRDTGARSG